MAFISCLIKQIHDSLGVGKTIKRAGPYMQTVAIQGAVRKIADVRLLRRNEKYVAAIEIVNFVLDLDSPLSRDEKA